MIIEAIAITDVQMFKEKHLLLSVKIIH